MAKVSRREKAFELFSRGKRPGDPEIDALGLSQKTIKKYLSLWRKQGGESGQAPCAEPAGKTQKTAPVAVPTVEEMPVGSVPDGGLFEHNGLLYRRKRQVYSGEVIATRMVGTSYTSTLSEKGLAEFKPGIMVTAK
jgi:hypothetical protein